MNNRLKITISILLLLITLPILGQNRSSISVDLRLKISKSINIESVQESRVKILANQSNSQNIIVNNSPREVLFQYYDRNTSVRNSKQYIISNISESLENSEIKILINNQHLLGKLNPENKNLLSHISTNEKLVVVYPDSDLNRYHNNDLALTIIY